MNDYRADLLHRMIKIYGFEHPLVVQFAISCECYRYEDDCSLARMWDDCLKVLVECHEKCPCYDDEDKEE